MTTQNNFDADWAFTGRLMLPRAMVERQIREGELAQAEAAVRVVRQVGSRQQPVTNADLDWATTLTGWGEPVLRMVEQAPTEAAYQLRLARNTAPEDQKRLTAIISLLRTRGELRKLARIPSDWTSIVDDLRVRFPNFHAVLDYVSAAFALADRGSEVAHFDPILLNGSPGCGKSMFADALANELGSGLLRLSMETAQSNSSLSGSAEFWSNTKSGELFNILIEKDYANPVIFLDEIDKAKARDYDPMSSLLGLFEPGTARTFCDLSYPWITLDASRVIWICTSNNADSLSAPILDRVRRFDIPDLTERQARAVVLQIYDELIQRMPGITWAIRLPRASVDVLMHVSPRRMRQALREGIGRAVLRRSKSVQPRDLMVKQVVPQLGRRIGFLP